MSHYCDGCQFDDEGNPDVCMGPPQEEPDWDRPEYADLPEPTSVTFTDELPF